MSLTDDIRSLSDQAIALLGEIKLKADAIDAQPPVGDPPPPPSGSGEITFPPENYVYHAPAYPLTVMDFSATKTGDGTFRLKSEAGTVVAESVSGNFNAVPWGQLYTLELVHNGTVLDSVNFGLGYHYLIWGQSNVVRFKDKPNGDVDVYGTAPRRCIIGIPNADGTEIVYHDSNLVNLEQGMSWIHLMNNLRSRGTDPEGRARNVPYCCTIVGQGGTNIQTLSSGALLTQFVNTFTNSKAGAGFMLQGESNAETWQDPALYNGYAALINAANSVRVVNWLMNVCDHAHNSPSGGPWPVALAQASIVSNFGNVYWGVDASRMGVGWSFPQSMGRGHGEVHFFGARNKYLGDIIADRIYNTRNYNI